jgi:hypothetical protein
MSLKANEIFYIVGGINAISSFLVVFLIFPIHTTFQSEMIKNG